MLIRASVTWNTSIHHPRSYSIHTGVSCMLERCTSSDEDEDSLVSWLLESSCRKLSQNTKTSGTVLE